MTDKLYIYWCPKCEIQTERGWHLYRRGAPLIPQTDIMRDRRERGTRRRG